MKQRKLRSRYVCVWIDRMTVLTTAQAMMVFILDCSKQNCPSLTKELEKSQAIITITKLTYLRPCAKRQHLTIWNYYFLHIATRNAFFFQKSVKETHKATHIQMHVHVIKISIHKASLNRKRISSTSSK